MPIGGVMATQGVVVPNAVGVDIGCGMCAVKTSLKGMDTATLKKIIGEIRKVIPVGFNKHDKRYKGVPIELTYVADLMPPMLEALDGVKRYEIIKQEYQNALRSLGTLGGGNHFIEIQKGYDGHIWIMIHSGSRNLGFKVANHYNKVAQELNEKYYSIIDKKQELAFLPLNTEEATAYLREMNYCVDFALANRELMMERVQDIFREVTGNNIEPIDPMFEPMINIAHNYATMENHFGKNVLIHRKGATSAKKEEKGIIPGSQGTSSYIVEGLGNPESFESCSHGAGRKMGRKDATRKLDLTEEIKKLDDQNIVHGVRHQNDLDEASGAYKNIDEVMNNQEDLVKILVKLTPMGVIKG